jgi:cysteine desulfurase
VADGRTYLDYNASAPLSAAARDAMVAALDLIGNPSSVHAEGRRLRGVIERAREAIAALVSAAPADVVLTSGASEANATVLRAGFTQVARAEIEHDSVLAPIAASGALVHVLPVTRAGVVCVERSAPMIAAMAAAIAARGGRGALAIQLANNETGVIQPVAALAALARAVGLHVHCDAVQAPGRIPVAMAELAVDTLVLSAHKMGGPKGVGALVLRDGLGLPPLVAGGGQERGRRAGTENVAAVAGFGAAAEVARRRLAEIDRVGGLRDDLERAVAAVTPQAIVVGRDAPRLSNTTALAIPGRSADVTVIKLDLAGVAVSAGAACSSGKVGRSRVLAAMGLVPDVAGETIRISLGHETTRADVDRFLAAWRKIHTNPAPGDPTGTKRTNAAERYERTAVGMGE